MTINDIIVKYGGAEIQVLFHIIQEFIKNGCKPVVITSVHFETATGLSNRQVFRALDSLDINVIAVKREKTSSNCYKYMVDLDKLGAVERHDINGKAIYNIYIYNKENISPDIYGKSEGEPQVRAFIDHYFTLYRNRYSVPYPTRKTKDDKSGWFAVTNMARGLVEEYGYEKLIALTNVFFDFDDDWVNSAGRTLAVFRSQIPKLLERERNTKRDSYKKRLAEWDGQA